MELHEYLEHVVDYDSFVAFVHALRADRQAEERQEQGGQVQRFPSTCSEWQNDTISDFLEAGLAYLEDTVRTTRPANDGKTPWRIVAEFLYAGNIYE